MKYMTNVMKNMCGKENIDCLVLLGLSVKYCPTLFAQNGSLIAVEIVKDRSLKNWQKNA